MPASQVVTYALDEDTEVRFEVEPGSGFRPVGAGEELIGRLQEAAAPAIAGARAVLEEARKAAPDEVELSFGIKVNGTMNWLVAKAATEGNFQVTLTWKSQPGQS